MIYHDEKLPQVQEYEDSILSTCLISPDAIPEISDVLSPDDFYSSKNSNTFNSIIKLHKAGDPVDTTTLTDKTGNWEWVNKLLDIPVASNIEHYCNVVKGAAVKRRVIEQANAIAKRAYSKDQAEDVLEFAQDAIVGINFGGGGDIQPVGVGIDKVFEDIDRRTKNEGRLLGWDTGFSKLNELTLGWQPGDFNIIAGRPAMGKSALMLNSALMAASKDIPIYVFSMEMGEQQIKLRTISTLSGINLQDIRSGRLMKDAHRRVNAARASISDIPLYIDYGSNQTVPVMRRKLRGWFRKHGIGPVFVDYLQLMDGAKKKYDRKDLEVGDISKGLKAIAKDLNTTVIALSQLNRGVENRTKKEPRLADLRESGALEQDASIVIFPYRAEVYLEKKYESNGDETLEYQKIKGQAKCIIAKHRDGPTGEFPLRWIAELASFKEKRDV